MGQRPRHENNVALAVTEHLVGDVDRPALDIASLRPGLMIAVAAPGGPVFEPRILAQDAALQVAELGARLDPELADQNRAQLPVRAQSVGLALYRAGRQQALEPEPLTQRVLGGQRL